MHRTGKKIDRDPCDTDSTEWSRIRRGERVVSGIVEGVHVGRPHHHQVELPLGEGRTSLVPLLVSDLPQFSEASPNGSPAKATRVTLPCGINGRIAAWTRMHDAEDVVVVLQRAGVHAAVVKTMRDLYEDQQLAARVAWQPYDHPELGVMRYRMVSYQLSDTPGRVTSAAPCLGEHNDQVFRDWLGLSAEEYQAFAAEGAFS